MSEPKTSERQTWREIISASNLAPASGANVARWYQRELPNAEELLYALAYALDGTLKVKHLQETTDE